MRRTGVCLLLALSAVPSGTTLSAQQEGNLHFYDPGGVGSRGPGAGGTILGPGQDLLQHRIDLGQFPNALCNDESGGVFYFRPYRGEANRNRWVIQLMGGGFCTDDKNCQQRWMGVNPLMPNFDADNMTSRFMFEAITDRDGILDRDQPANPVRNWNHVLAHYCSSDTWSGAANALLPRYDSAHNWLRRPNQFVRLPFMGRRIFNAMVDTLRGCDGNDDTLLYSGPNVGNPTPARLPDLDDAEHVLLAGGSAGGVGVINNLDHLNVMLHTDDRDCTTPVSPALAIGGLIDSAFPPALESRALDLESSLHCAGLAECSFDAITRHSATDGTRAMWSSRVDASCLAWHSVGQPGQGARDGENQGDGNRHHCADDQHVLLNHVTTPFFVRMGQTDELVLRLYQPSTSQALALDIRLRAPGQRETHPMTEDEFAGLVRLQALGLTRLRHTAEEKERIFTTPGAFVPACSRHDTMGSSDLHDATINGMTMFRAMELWADRRPATQSIIVSRRNDSVICGS